MPKASNKSRRRERQREEEDVRSSASSHSSNSDEREGAGVESSDMADDAATDNAAGLKIKRPSVRFNEEKKARKKAKLGKGDMSDSSTGSSSAIRTVKLPPLKATNYKNMIKRGARRLKRTVNRSVTRLPRGYPRRTKEVFESLIPRPVYDEYWTKDDQDALEEDANNDDDFTERYRTESYMLAVWKTVFRFTGRLATDIIGPKTYLDFKSGSVLGKHAKWTAKFCDHLLTIVVHPWFNFDTDKMALAIQWSVICRTDDRRVYRLSGCDDDMFLLELVTVIQNEQDGTKTAQELRELACSRYMEKFPNKSEHPRWSQFLDFIERQACPREDEADGKKGSKSKKGKEPAPSETESWGLFASVPDLKAVVVALDRMRHGRIRMFTDADTVAETFKLTRDIYDPPDQELTVKAIKGVYLQVMRNKLRLERGGPPEITPLRASAPREGGGNVDEAVFEEEGEGLHLSSDDEDVIPSSSRWSRKRPAKATPVQPQSAQKRPRGRPRKNAVSGLEGTRERGRQLNRGDDADDEDEDEDEDVTYLSPRQSRKMPTEAAPVEPQFTQKRPRGRPRKNPLSGLEGTREQGRELSLDVEAEPQSAQKRPRGRPRKNPVSGLEGTSERGRELSLDLEAEPRPAQKRPPGRPRKNPVSGLERGRGFTRVIDDDDEDENEDADVIIPSSSRKRLAEAAPVPQPARKRSRGRPDDDDDDDDVPQTHGFTNLELLPKKAHSRIRRTRSVIVDSQSGTDAPVGGDRATDDGSIMFDEGFLEPGDSGRYEESVRSDQPKVSQPNVAESEVVEPGVAQPKVTQPDVAEPGVVEPQVGTGISDDEEAILQQEIDEMTETISVIEQQSRRETRPVRKAVLERRLQIIREQLRSTQEAQQEQRGYGDNEGAYGPPVKVSDGLDETYALPENLAVSRETAPPHEPPYLLMVSKKAPNQEEAVAALEEEIGEDVLRSGVRPRRRYLVPHDDDMTEEGEARAQIGGNPLLTARESTVGLQLGDAFISIFDEEGEVHETNDGYEELLVRDEHYSPDIYGIVSQ